jgi:hypothetical protein
MPDANKNGLLRESEPDNFHQSITPLIHQSNFYA